MLYKTIVILNRTLVIAISTLLSLQQATAQYSRQTDLIILHNYSITTWQSDSSVLAFRIIIINIGGTEYYYPKSVTEKLRTGGLYISLKDLPYHRSDRLTPDIGGISATEFDTLIAIPPGDTLIISYEDILLDKRDRQLATEIYITDNKSAMRMRPGGSYYYDNRIAYTKMIRYEIGYDEGKIEDSIYITPFQH